MISHPWCTCNRDAELKCNVCNTRRDINRASSFHGFQINNNTRGTFQDKSFPGRTGPALSPTAIHIHWIYMEPCFVASKDTMSTLSAVCSAMKASKLQARKTGRASAGVPNHGRQEKNKGTRSYTVLRDSLLSLRHHRDTTHRPHLHVLQVLSWRQPAVLGGSCETAT